MKYFKENLALWAFAFFKVPLLFAVRPRIVEMSEERCTIRIPLTRKTKNHLKCMYFAVYAIGADAAAAIFALKLIRQSKLPIQLLFKTFEADFHRRAHADVDFVCEDGAKLKALIERARQSPERQSEEISVHALAKGEAGIERVADFKLMISVKNKPKK